MKTTAIICEYNPFHKGHEYQIARTKELCGADFIVAIMSGNYVQRGDVAIFSKKLRARAAIASGVDLVIELPTVFAMQSAEFFAQGGVSTANALGIVDFLSFGTECDDIQQIKEIATLLCNETAEFSALLKEQLGKGMSYPVARAIAIAQILGSDAAELINSPNNILSIEYCKALYKLNSNITPIAVKRKGAGHDSTTSTDGFASATHLRQLIAKGEVANAFPFIPDSCRQIFKDANIHCISSMEKSIVAEIIKMPTETLAEICDVGEGMENRIKAAALTAESISELAGLIKTKRYTHSRIRRILLSAYLGITDQHRSMDVPYIKILDHNERGQELISKMKKTASLPIVRNTSQINKLKNPEIKAFWEMERTFDKLYELFKI